MTTLARPQVVSHRYDARLTGALITGVVGGLFGLGGFLAVLLGDGLIALGVTAAAAAGLAALGLLAAIVVRELPGYAAFGMAIPLFGYLAAFGGNWTTWWAKYQEAVATSGAAENIFWSAMPAMALFAISGVLFALGALLAAFNALSQSEAE